jgi:RNA-directed DNA polymerase
VRKALEWRWSEGATSFSCIARSTSQGRNLVEKAKPLDISKRQVWAAYKRVKANQGAAGVEGQSITECEEDVANNLYTRWNRMASGRYFPPPVRRVEIPQGDGSGTRPLGMPPVADRGAQAVAQASLEPEVEPHFHPDSSGYRPGKSALEVGGVARQRCWRADWVLDLDIRRYFDSIDHTLLMRAVRKHPDCSGVLLYIDRWLKAPTQ